MEYDDFVFGVEEIEEFGKSYPTHVVLTQDPVQSDFAVFFLVLSLYFSSPSLHTS